MDLSFARRTDIGFGRGTNQDRLFGKVGEVYGRECGLFCVADGVGGASDGQLAAEAAVNAAERWWHTGLPVLVSKPAGFVCHELLRFVSSVNGEIITDAKVKSTKSGTTLSLLFICGRTFYIAHSGDSRIYMARRGLFTSARLLTEDHSWAAQQRKDGASAAEIEKSPHKNKITSCLGMLESPQIFTSAGRIRGRGAFILCSDGLYRTMTDDELAKTAKCYRESEEIAGQLLRTALSRETGDNVSVIAVTF